MPSGRFATMTRFALFVILASILAVTVNCRAMYDVSYDNAKEEEYETVMQAVLSLGYRSSEFDWAGCKAWCTLVIPPYFPTHVDLTPRCEQECHRFLHRTTYQNAGDL